MMIGGEDDRRADLERRVAHDRRPPAAVRSGGLALFSRSRRTTFSTSMIASSTSAPMAIAMPPSVIVLMVAPNARSTSTAAASDSGIAVSVIAAARRLARNNRTIDDDQEAAVAQRRDDVVDRHLDEVGLPEDLAVDGHARAAAPVCSASSSRSSRAGQLDGVGAGLLLHADDHRRLAAARAFAALERAAFAHVGHVADQHRPRAAQRDDAVADLLRRPDAADRLQHVFLRPFGVDAGRGVLARAAHRVEQLGERHAVGAQLVGMRDDLELPLGAADRRDLRHAGTASSRRRTTVSATVRSVSGSSVSDEIAKNRISPMIDEIGASTGRSTCGGSVPPTSASFSATIWRAPKMSVPQSNSTQTTAMPTRGRGADAPHARGAVDRRSRSGT